MSRRDAGPKRRANAYAQRNYLTLSPSDIKAALVRAWMSGYGSAARARRARSVTPITPSDTGVTQDTRTPYRGNQE